MRLGMLRGGLAWLGLGCAGLLMQCHDRCDRWPAAAWHAQTGFTRPVALMSCTDTPGSLCLDQVAAGVAIATWSVCQGPQQDAGSTGLSRASIAKHGDMSLGCGVHVGCAGRPKLGGMAAPPGVAVPGLAGGRASGGRARAARGPRWAKGWLGGRPLARPFAASSGTPEPCACCAGAAYTAITVKCGKTGCRPLSITAASCSFVCRHMHCLGHQSAE